MDKFFSLNESFFLPIKPTLKVMIFFTFLACNEKTAQPEEANDRLTARVLTLEIAQGQTINSKLLAERVIHIKQEIIKNKEWTGGHSPFPSRLITANTFEKVRKEISAGDSEALIILIQDDAGDVRSLATSLLECLNPDAEVFIKNHIALESNSERRNRLNDALVQIDVIRSGRTSCK